jgi:hypothetical protein
LLFWLLLYSQVLTCRLKLLFWRIFWLTWWCFCCFALVTNCLLYWLQLYKVCSIIIFIWWWHLKIEPFRLCTLIYIWLLSLNFHFCIFNLHTLASKLSWWQQRLLLINFLLTIKGLALFRNNSDRCNYLLLLF